MEIVNGSSYCVEEMDHDQHHLCDTATFHARAASVLKSGYDS